MNTEYFALLYEYNAWANHRLLDACAVLSREQLMELAKGRPWGAIFSSRGWRSWSVDRCPVFLVAGLARVLCPLFREKGL